jgi:hypothetical protein
MNKELISKLRKQSKVDPKEIVKALADTNDGKAVEHWLEQFAEQIVRECAEFVDYRLTNPDGASMAWCDGSDIKEHFGVEDGKA